MSDFKNENIWLMKGDCLERMKEIPDGSVDLVLTDPPYKMTKNGKSCRPNYMSTQRTDTLFSGQKLPNQLEYLKESYRVMGRGHLYLFTNVKMLTESLNNLEKAGFRLHNVISMIKDTKMPNRWYLKYTELVIVAFKGKAKAINDKTSRDYVNVIMPKTKDKLHITQKPYDFIEKLVTNSTEEGDTVLDMFMGSGTTIKAAHNTKRKAIGIELGYCEKEDHLYSGEHWVDVLVEELKLKEN
ncbi:DNA methylase [Vibrio phage 1.187.O._10N.286.49.F1]|nr:DNA methylase [Vibrio phage 1.187.O._10N.286.49.F1]